MIESVSNTQPAKKIGVMDKVTQEQLHSPGAYALPPELMGPQPVYKKRGGFFGFLGKILLLALVLGAGTIAARRYSPSINKIDLSTPLAEGAKPMEKIKYDFARFADWLEKYTIGLFKKIKKIGNNTQTTPTPAPQPSP